jgi:peptide/nickel transport system substrate-binding protein
MIKNKFKSTWLLGLLLIAGLFFIAACSDDTNDAEAEGTSDENGTAEAQEGGSITVKIEDDPDFLDPHMAEASMTFRIILNIFEGLMAADNDGSLLPGLAEEYEVSDDGLTYTFHLREGVTFHNGDPLTAEDVKYTFERLTGLGGGDPLNANFDFIESVEASDEHTVVFQLEQPNSAFLPYLTAQDSAILPASNDGSHNENPIGTGPFKFESYNPGSDLVVTKNEDYWEEGIPYLDEATFRFQSDSQTALMSMMSGELDLMDVEPHRLSEVEDDFTIELQQANSTLLVGYNHDREPFNDVNVRKAINYAIDTDQIIDIAFSGYAEKLGSHMSPAMGSIHREGLEDVYDRDVDKAKELLAEAGYADGFNTTITISAHREVYADIAQVVVENLREVGIEVDIEVIEWGVWLDRVYMGRDFDMTAIDITGYLNPHETMTRYSSDHPENYYSYENEEYDQLMADVLLEDDEEARADIYKKAQELLSEDAAAAYLLDYQFAWVLNPELEGYQHYPFFFHDLSEVRFTE